MYYSVRTNRLGKAFQFFAAVLIFNISFFTFQTKIFGEEVFNSTAEEYRVKGYEEQRNGDYGRALSYYAKAISLGAGNAVIYNDTGVVYEHLNIIQKAEEYYLKAIDLDPSYPPPYANVAYLYLDRGDTKKAITYFRKRLEIATEHDLWAEKIEQELIKIDPVYKNKIIQEELEQKGREILQKEQDELTLKVMRSENHYQQGVTFLGEKQFDKAVESFDLALTITPDNPKIIKTKERAIFEKQIDDIKKRTERAVVKLDAGEVDAAKREFQEILSVIPKQSNQEAE